MRNNFTVIRVDVGARHDGGDAADEDVAARDGLILYLPGTPNLPPPAT